MSKFQLAGFIPCNAILRCLSMKTRMDRGLIFLSLIVRRLSNYARPYLLQLSTGTELLWRDFISCLQHLSCTVIHNEMLGIRAPSGNVCPWATSDCVAVYYETCRLLQTGRADPSGLVSLLIEVQGGIAHVSNDFIAVRTNWSFKRWRIAFILDRSLIIRSSGRRFDKSHSFLFHSSIPDSNFQVRTEGIIGHTDEALLLNFCVQLLRLLYLAGGNEATGAMVANLPLLISYLLENLERISNFLNNALPIQMSLVDVKWLSVSLSCDRRCSGYLVGPQEEEETL